MTITSKFNGTCKNCGGVIAKGQQIEWSKETGPTHIKCPAVSLPNRPASSPTSTHPRIHGSAAPASPYTRPAPKPGQQPQRFVNVERAYHAAEREVVTRDAWLSDFANQLNTWPPLDALKAVATLLHLQQQRVDSEYRLSNKYPKAAACAVR